MRPEPATLASTLLATALAAALAAGPGTAAPATPGPAVGPAPQALLGAPTTLSLSMSTNDGAFTLAPDGTFWVVSGYGTGFAVRHYDAAGSDVGDAAWSKSGNFGLVKSMGYSGGRVFVMVGETLRSWVATSGAEQRVSDSDTNRRLGSNQMVLRVTPGGLGRVALGQNNKVGLLDLTNNATTSPFYGQTWFGGGVNTGHPANVMETCVLPASGPPTGGEPPINCGNQLGSPDVFSYAIDTAPAAGGSGGVAVLSSGAGGSSGPRVSIVAPVGAAYQVVGSFGGAGTGDGQFANPFSIVLAPGSLHYFVSDQDNRRILEFGPDGTFVAGYGIGVATGGSAFEVCGPGRATCGPATGGPYYGQLEVSADGTKLYAQRGSSGVLEVFTIGDPGTPPPPPPGGGGTTPTTPTTPTAPPVPPTGPEQVRLEAQRTRVAPGAKARLTATAAPAALCTGRRVQFQVKDGRSWDRLGGPRRLRADCTATRSTGKVTRRVQLRVLLVDPATSATTATSKVVTVRPARG